MKSEKQQTKLKRALLIEDNIPCQIIMTNNLHELNYEVDLADEGQKAVKMAQDKLYDLIISDVRNKGLSGEKVVPLIRETINVGTPLFVWSAFVNKNDDPMYLRWGADAALTKPCTIDDIKIAIAKCSKRRRKERESRHRIKNIKKKWQHGGGRINSFEELFHLSDSKLWILIDALLTIIEYKQWEDLSHSAVRSSQVITEWPNP